MKTWLVDTNVLLDVIGADRVFGQQSLEVLTTCAEAGALVINPVVYAQVGVWIDTMEELNDLLPEDLFRREAIPWEGAYLAAQAFGRYRRAGGRRPRMLADFLVGAHAAVAGYGLITRDRGYRKFFEIELLDPART